MSKVALYANVGADLTHYDVDVDSAALTKRDHTAPQRWKTSGLVLTS